MYQALCWRYSSEQNRQQLLPLWSWYSSEGRQDKEVKYVVCQMVTSAMEIEKAEKEDGG